MAILKTWWEIAGLILSVAQAVYHLKALKKYKEKLEAMAEQLDVWGDKNKEKYNYFRSADPEFYSYYMALPGYAICESNIQRSKGRAFKKYGNTLRKIIRTTRGFTPLMNVHMANKLGYESVHESATTRAVSHINEERRVDDHVIERWTAIVEAPVGVEGFRAKSYANIIDRSFGALKESGRGFNSAGASFGTYLYKLLN